MVGDSLLEGAAPPEDLARGGIGVELRDLRADEEVVLLLDELLADVHWLVLEKGLVLFHRLFTPRFRSLPWCSGSHYSRSEANSSSQVAACDADPSTGPSWRDFGSGATYTR